MGNSLSFVYSSNKQQSLSNLSSTTDANKSNECDEIDKIDEYNKHNMYVIYINGDLIGYSKTKEELLKMIDLDKLTKMFENNLDDCFDWEYQDKDDYVSFELSTWMPNSIVLKQRSLCKIEINKILPYSLSEHWLFKNNV